MSAENTPYNERTRAIRRRAAASRAAFALHEQRPELAAEAGRKGGAARVAQMVDPRAYGQWLARRRWHGALAGPAPTRTKKEREGER